MAQVAQEKLTMDTRLEFMKNHLKRFVEYRYHDAFMHEVPNFHYEVKTEFNFSMNSILVSIISGNGFYVCLRVAAGVEFQVKDRDDWMCYQLQALEPLMDTLVFIEWLWNQMNFDDKRIYKKHLQGTIKRVVFVPPQVDKGRWYRSRYDPDGQQQTVAPDWLARVEFDNGACRREIIENIRDDSSTWVAMMLMAKQQEDFRGNT